MSLNWLMQMIFGSMFALRICLFYANSKQIESKLLTKIGTAIVLIFFALTFIEHKAPSLVKLLVFMILLCLVMGLSYLSKQKKRVFRGKIQVFINLMMIKMRSGLGFRSAYSSALSEISDEEFASQLEQMIERESSAQHSVRYSEDLFGRRVVKQLCKARSLPHQSIEQLLNLRRHLKIESDFRRRSGQILLQLRIQSLVLCLLYILLLLFTLHHSSFAQIRSLLGLSLLLFVMGTLVFWKIGGLFKWKV